MGDEGMDMAFRSAVLRPLPLCAVALVLAIGAAAWGTAQWGSARSGLSQALDALPATAESFGFTDWSQVHRIRGAEERDLKTRSAIADGGEPLASAFGWSAADVRWEAYGQLPTGPVLMVRFDSGVSFEDLRSKLRGLGYDGSEDRWFGDEAAQQVAGFNFAAAFASVALAPRRRLLVAAADVSLVDEVMATIARKRASLAAVPGAVGVAQTLSGTATSLLSRGEQACAEAGLEGLGQEVERQAHTALQRSGALTAYEFAGRGLVDDGSGDQVVRFAMSFGSVAEAGRQRLVRERLAVGPFIGRVGDISEVLDLKRSTVSSGTLTMDFDHAPDSGTLMSGRGPLLFASCPHSR